MKNIPPRFNITGRHTIHDGSSRNLVLLRTDKKVIVCTSQRFNLLDAFLKYTVYRKGFQT